MAVPTKEKTWEYNLGTTVAGAFNQVKCDNAWLAIRNVLTSGGFTAPWVVWGSSDGVGAGNGDYVDRWVNDTDLIHNSPGNDHSWIVLENPNGVFLCIDLYASGGDNYAYLIWSDGPFNSDGTIKYRPTGGQLLDSAAVLPGTASNWIINAQISTDGKHTILFLANAGGINQLLIVGQLKEIVTGETWTGKYAFWAGASTGMSLAYTSFWASQVGGYLHGEYSTGSFTGFGCNAALVCGLLTVADEDVGTPPVFEMGFLCDTPGHRGLKGRVVDLWWGCAVTSTGDTYPVGGTREFLELGDIVIPWNGSVPVLA